MRVFVTGTGRCGTVSFKIACEAMTNYTVAHKTPCGHLLYPDNHIEVNPMLRGCIAVVAETYPTAKWAHLIRTDRDACARSLATMEAGTILQKWADIRFTTIPNRDPFEIGRAFWRDENAIIDNCLTACVPNAQRMVVRLEHAAADFAIFWDWISAEGNKEAAIATWQTPHHTTAERTK